MGNKPLTEEQKLKESLTVFSSDFMDFVKGMPLLQYAYSVLVKKQLLETSSRDMLAGSTGSSKNPGSAMCGYGIVTVKKKGKNGVKSDVTSTSISDFESLQKEGAKQEILKVKQELAKATSENLEKWTEKISKFEVEGKTVPDWLRKQAASCEKILEDMTFD